MKNRHGQLYREEIDFVNQLSMKKKMRRGRGTVSPAVIEKKVKGGLVFCRQSV
ncbi:MAG: hypothetical protein KKD01_17010 [Proteobacteria bacterium]|nr:hypothetical protein [Pseudomonadota bacterium]MBU1138110.1 hypothetical protein [Pseudomonadota bacterium]MBU1234403.1 hypothetical protein [Pseudomonadota bacterium]MBU1417614.1 hypothetical protein [Pseudomonadota bacterium]MBU1456427.1 hypothetical protein [Pseudomonadota bacterium]